MSGLVGAELRPLAFGAQGRDHVLVLQAPGMGALAEKNNMIYKIRVQREHLLGMIKEIITNHWF